MLLDKALLLIIAFAVLFTFSLLISAVEGKEMNTLTILLNVAWTLFIIFLPVLFILFFEFVEYLSDVIYNTFIKKQG